MCTKRFLQIDLIGKHNMALGKKKNTSRVKYGYFIDELGLFDTKFFNMFLREAEHADHGGKGNTDCKFIARS